MKMGVKILGTKAEDVDAAEDRELFDEILEKHRFREQQVEPCLLQRKRKKLQTVSVIRYW